MGERTMKELKPSTIKAYTLSQLVNHADRYQDYHLSPAYRFEMDSRYYVKVYLYSAEDHAYFFDGMYDKESFVDRIIYSLYH